MKNKKLLFAGLSVVVVAIAVFLFVGRTRPLTIENQMFHLDEAKMPEFSADGLDKNTIESIEYTFEKDGIFDITEDYKLVAIEDIGDPIICEIKVTADGKKYGGEFYAHTDYATVDVKNGDMPLGEKSGPCPLKVENAEIGQKCYLYFKNNGSGDDFAFIVTGESSIDKKVPAGKYTLYVAYGYVTQDWYGIKYLFGKDGTDYYMREEPLDFTSSRRGVSGYTMTVLDQEGGQVDLKRINYSEFPGSKE